MAAHWRAEPGDLSLAGGSGPGELLRYRSARGRWVVAAMVLGSSVAGIDSTVVAVALRPDQLDLRGRFHQRRGARRSLSHPD